MKKFEYKSISLTIDVSWLSGKVKDFAQIDTELNQMGNDGWEIVNFSLGNAVTGDINTVLIIMKREIQ